MTSAVELHPKLQPLAFLLGTWVGKGEGVYPTITPFTYEEEAKFWHTGKPVLHYTHRTWNDVTRKPMHGESGYWRVRDDGTVEAVIAQATGIAEVQNGVFDEGDAGIRFRSSLIGNANKVFGIHRHVWVSEDSAAQPVRRTLSYEVDMQTDTQPLQRHLAAVLYKTDA
eukprot:jgi/Chlat1/3060/Chrsp21S03313